VLSRHTFGFFAFELQPESKLSAGLVLDRDERSLYQFVQGLATTLVEAADLREVAFIEIVTHFDHRMLDTNTVCGVYSAFGGLEP
jgi:hypothetical protein